MLSIMNEIDPCLLLPLCVLYEIQNQIYQQYHQDVDTSNLIPIPSEPPLINSTHTSNQNIPSTQKSPPHPSHISSWNRILKATIAHTHNLSTLSGSRHALNEDQPELPSKRHAVSQVVEENKQILAEAGYQPC